MTTCRNTALPLPHAGSRTEPSCSAWWQGLLLAGHLPAPAQEYHSLNLPWSPFPFPILPSIIIWGDTFTYLLGMCHSMCAEVSFHTLGIKLR